jgi:ammonia channel protein AmtB
MSLGRRAATVLATAGVLILVTPAVAGAQDVDPVEAVTSLGQQTNLLWIVIGAVLVIFMQAGFALVETGFCRAKHAAHVVSTNFAIFGLGFVGFFLVGYALAFGGYSYVLPGYDFGYSAPLGDALIGSGNWVFLFQGGFALSGDSIVTAGAPAVFGFFLYMVAFMDTVATIPTGAMAERWKWKAFVGWGLFCGAVYYPIFAAWTWGGGWLGKTWDSMNLGAGYVDFAGSGVVHAVGGVAALAGAIVLGPRIGKFNRDGSPNTLPGHHIPMATLGCFILLFGWFGFNAASTLAATDVQFAVVAANTAIAASFGAVVAMFVISRALRHVARGRMAVRRVLAPRMAAGTAILGARTVGAPDIGPARRSPARAGRPSASRFVVSVVPWVTRASPAGHDPGARQQQPGAGPAHQGQQGLLDGHACDVGDHVVFPPVADAWAARSCTRPGRSASVWCSSSCQVHHSYGGVWG